jgi:hypothetical protein
MIANYRKKTEVIQAIQWTGDNLWEVINFTGFHPSAQEWTWEEYERLVASDGLKIFTPEGPLKAAVGDYVIKNDHDEVYVCKPDRFLLTHEKEE